jgi:hypothetical protein
MSNPNITPRPENLSRAGLGQPLKGLQRIQVTLSPELIQRLEEIQRQQDWKRNYLIEQALRVLLGMPSDYDEGDFSLIVKGRTVD